MVDKITVWLNSPKFTDEETTRKAQLLHTILITIFGLLMTLPIAGYMVLENPAPAMISFIILEIITVLSLVLLNLGKIKLTSYIFISSTWLTLTIVGYYFGGTENPTIYAYTVIVLMAGLLLGIRTAAVYSAVSITSIWAIHLLEINSQLPKSLLEINSLDRVVGITFIVITTLILLSLALTSMNDSFQRARRNEGLLVDANWKLVQAYESTLEGWVRALELRDKQTEGHSRQVVNMTIELAQEFGIDGTDLEHIRRGALLHDIGKMAIPDQVLLKPGPLTDAEWVIMREHPKHAQKLLSAITFLEPALPIPCFHHERWDGNGYPYGLRGQQIPLPARIFAVVDFWDAVTSDRPYRSAWEEEKCIRYLQEHKGEQFDPVIVEQFLNMIEREPELVNTQKIYN